jgi:mono/diheme cytochrome c family protein
MRNVLVASAVVALTLGTGAAPPMGAPQRDESWDHEIRPLFARVCAECHTRDGEAGIDLATPAAWRRRYDDVLRSVVVDKTMPPSGRAFSDADRETVRAWVEGRR